MIFNQNSLDTLGIKSSDLKGLSDAEQKEFNWNTMKPSEKLAQSNEYMEALEQARVDQNIVLFTKFIASCIQ